MLSGGPHFPMVRTTVCSTCGYVSIHAQTMSECSPQTPTKAITHHFPYPTSLPQQNGHGNPSYLHYPRHGPNCPQPYQGDPPPPPAHLKRTALLQQTRRRLGYSQSRNPRDDHGAQARHYPPPLSGSRHPRPAGDNETGAETTNPIPSNATPMAHTYVTIYRCLEKADDVTRTTTKETATIKRTECRNLYERQDPESMDLRPHSPQTQQISYGAKAPRRKD